MDIAVQRWGAAAAEPGQAEPAQDIPQARTAGEEPATAPLPPEATGRVRPPSPQHPSPFGSWSGASLPLRETWRTYTDGAARVMEEAPVLVIAYWAAGLPLFAVHAVCRLGQDSTTSVTRGLVFAVVVVVLVTGIALAL
ncbi:MAG: hypothetical protein FWE35_01050 [Streptosporangiales bacterium]|nr:hypothetical protein [Streptosporangiales bacterium]